MRPPRIAILVLFTTASIFIVCRALTSASHAKASSYSTEVRSTRTFFGFTYYNTPFSLFPPNAAISLTDDNSTSFAARPAAFGPKLAAAGLSGQLWVGSGFAEDSLDGNGELGCSDLPGWGSGNTRAALKNSFRAASPRVAATRVNSGLPKRGGQLLDADNRDAIAKGRPHSRVADDADDNTDNHLNEEALSPGSRRDISSASSHADIQSIQEAAEIQGKVVLLMRGGCGFLEKVMWAQRRGAIAVIVGDNQKGGPLIQMFAHGDEVDNVTVPSVFTARTTAHLLSSLTQPGSFIEDTLDDNGNAVLKVQQGPKVGQDSRKRAPVSRRTTAFPKTASPTSKAKRAVHDKGDKPTPSVSGRGWFSGIFRLSHSPRSVDDESRPPSSGRLDWVLVEDWNDEKDKLLKDSLRRSKKPQPNQDDFVIGVQDWRDPDLVHKSGLKPKDKATEESTDEKTTLKSKDRAGSPGKSASDINGPKGGSITPGSGEYVPARSSPKDGKKEAVANTGTAGSGAGGKGHGIISRLFGDDETVRDPETEASTAVDDHAAESETEADHEGFEPHEGLWVTITPTNSASPFFDTLLVLVISPLVTLTVVYALLIVRARIRRRRWRAPKSVVDRLPVRTYHTVAASPSSSPRLPSPSSATPTTPLLQHSPPRPRPRSRTTTGVLESENFVSSSAMPTPQASTRSNGRPEHEKGAGGFSAEWRKYMGRQVECVVCLEEYVDGVSRVMSLPCGHEFHADCITPWLTTRRRTCPICKGDVVRSLAHSSRSGPRYERYHDDSDEDADAEASSSDSPERATDLEHGIFPSEADDTHQSTRQEGWLGLLSNRLGIRTRQPSGYHQQQDRSR